MEWISIAGMTIGIYPVLEAIAPGLKVFFSSRIGGTSRRPFDSLNLGTGHGDRSTDVRRNRKLLLGALGIPPSRLARMEQVHGSAIRIAKRGKVYTGSDGLVTSTRDLALVISTADCCPVIIYSPTEKALAALHVGRSGAAGGIVERTMRLLSSRYEIDTDHTIALIGPGICRKCHTVRPETAGRFQPDVTIFTGGEWHLDLPKHCTRELRKMGLKPKNIFKSGLCTSCEERFLFSHRRDRGRTGRHWTLAYIAGSGGDGPTPQRDRASV